MANINGRYAFGSVSTISAGERTFGTAADVTNDWVGRIVFFTNGSAIREYRRIESVDATANEFTVDVSFDTNPFRSITDLNTGNNYATLKPSVGDNFTISWNFNDEDIRNNADITVDSDGNYVNITGGTQIQTGVVIYDENVTITWSYGQDNSLRVLPGGAVILGRQHFGDTDDNDALGYTSNSCTVLDNSDTTSGAQDQGTFHMNGGEYKVISTGSTGLFLRFYDQNSAADSARQNFRMWDVAISGNFGGRIDGAQTIVKNVTTVDNQSTLGMFNPLSPAIFLDNAARGTSQAIYHFPDQAGDVTVEAFDIQDISDRVIFINTANAPTNNTLTLNNWSFPDLSAVTASGTGVNTFERSLGEAAHIVRFTKDVEFTVVNVDGTDVVESGSNEGHVIFRDAFADLTQDSDGGDGVFPSISLIGRDARPESDTAFGSFDSEAFFDIYTPYDYAIKYRNHRLLLGNTSFETGSGAFTQTLTRIRDDNITDTDVDSVDAYTDLGTAARMYDYADKFKNENIQQPVPLEQFFTKSSDVLTFTQANVDVELLSTLTPVMAYLGDLIENDRELNPRFLNATSVDRDEISVSTAASFSGTVLTLAQAADWNEWENNYLWINLNEVADDAVSFLENARSHGNITVTDTTVDGFATFALDADASIFTLGANANARGIQLGAITAQSGSAPALASQLTQLSYQEDTRLCLKTPAAGYTGGMIIDGGNLTVDTEIQGQLTCDTINHSFVDGDRIINTSEAINATISLAPGEYFIDDADISSLTINRDSDSGTVTITNNENVSGNPTLGTGVQLNLVLEVTIDGPGATDGLLSVYDSDGTFLDSVNGNTISVSIVDHPTLTNSSTPIWVWSGPGYTDVRGTDTVVFGTNVFTETPLVKRYQDFSGDPPAATVDSDEVVDTDTDYALFHISGATGTNVFTDGTFNYFANVSMVGLESYNQLIASDSEAIHSISSTGATGTAAINATYIRMTPGEDACQLLGFILNEADNDDTLTIDRVTSGITIECLVPASALSVDTALLTTLYQDISDEQLEDIRGTNTSVDMTSLRKSIFAASQL